MRPFYNPFQPARAVCYKLRGESEHSLYRCSSHETADRESVNVTDSWQQPPYRRTKIFSVFTRDRRIHRRLSLRSPSVPRESPVKRRPNEPTRAQNSAAVPFVPAMCASPSLFLPAVVLSSSSFLLSSPFLHSFILSLPELSTRGRKKTHNSDSPPSLSLSLILSLPLRLLRSSRSTSEPAIRSLASLVFSRDNGSLFFVGSAR